MEIETLNSARGKPCQILMIASVDQLRAVYGAEVKPKKTKLRAQYIRERERLLSPEAMKPTHPEPRPNFLWISGLGCV